MSEKLDRQQVKIDLEKFGRNIKSKMHFFNEPSSPFSEVPAFKAPSKWTPIIKDTHLEMYLSETEDQILKTDENYLNLTEKEREAMKELMNDCSNIIKPAYKGSRIVSWGKQDYLRECENQLTDVNVYEKVEGDPARATNKKIFKVFDNMLRKKETHKKLKS